ncbi:MAG: lipocalin family protein [Sediminicola sp.]
MEKRTYIVRYILFFMGVPLLFIFLLANSNNPDASIIGEWKEVEWKYEKTPSRDKRELTEGEKKSITKGLYIHEAETWKFLPNGRVILSKDGKEEELGWTLKGRGHILKLYHLSDQSEHYNLYNLNENEMVLYFHTELHAKSIVKLKFKKIDKDPEYAQKI